MNVLELIGAGGRRKLHLPLSRVLGLVSGLAWGVLLLFSGCAGAEDFSDTPEIAPLRVTQKTISEVGGAKISRITVVISWKDGNGDLGYIEGNNDTKDFNYFVNTEKRKVVGGQPQFVAITPPTTSPAGWRFINLNPESRTSTTPFKLRGELAYEEGFVVTPPSSIGTISGVNETVRKGDVLRFKVQIKDRAGNLSNKITTQEVTL